MTTPRRATDFLLTVLVVLLGVNASLGQTVPPKPDQDLQALDTLVNSFLKGVSQGQTQSAYQEFLADSQLADREKALEDLVDKTKQLHAKYGEYRGFEQIAAKRVGDDLVLLRYLYKCRDFPVVWYFTFYRTRSSDEAASGNNKWRVITVRFDTELEALWF